MTINDRFPELAFEIFDVGRRERYENRILEELRDILDGALAGIIQNAPEGQDDPHLGIRPSVRQHGTQLDDAFEPDPVMTSTPDRISGSLVIDHPTYDSDDWGGTGIFEWLTEGTRRHTYTGNPFLVFWWGDPLPWTPASPPASLTAPGKFAFAEIEHPGIEGMDWATPYLDDAVEQIEDFMPKVGEIIFEPLFQSDILRHG